MEDKALIMPAVALRGMAILPGMVAHFDISRSRSLKAVEHAMMGEQKLFLVAQRDIEQDSPKQEELFNVGIIADVKQVVKLQNDIVRILVEGIHRAKLLGFTDCGDFLEAQIAIIEEQTNEIDQQEYQAMVESVKDTFLKYTVVNGRIAKDVLRQVSTMTDLAKLIDYVTNNLPIRYDSKQKLLEATDLKERYEILITILYNEIEITELKNDFQKKVKERVDKHQKEYIIREQMGLIRE